MTTPNPLGPPTLPPPAADPEPRKSRKRWYLVGGAAVLALIVAIGVAAPDEPEVDLAVDVEVDDGATTTVEETVAPTTEAPATTAAPTVPPMPEPDPVEPVEAWDLSGWPSLNDYCYTDCTSIYQAEMLSYFVEADLEELGSVLDFLEPTPYSELDAVCADFFTMSDDEVMATATANGLDPVTWNTALYMVCDS